MDASRLRINIEQILAPVWLSRFFHARSRFAVGDVRAVCGDGCHSFVAHSSSAVHTFLRPCRLIERTQTNHQVASGAGFRRCPESQTYEEQR